MKMRMLPPCIPALFVLCLALALPPFECRAQNEILNQELSSQQKRLKSVEKAIRQKRSKKRKIEQQQHDVLSEIEKLDVRIASQWKSLQQAKEDWTEAELDLEKTTVALNEKSRETASLKEHAELRFNALRQMGEVGFLNVFFAAQSLPDLLSTQEYLKMILDEDRARRSQYLAAITDLSSKQGELKKRQALLKVMSARLEKETLLLEERKQDKEQYLAKLKQQSGSYSTMISQLGRAKKKLKEVVDELTLRAKSADKAMEPVSTENQFDFRAQKGRLNLPAPGKVIASRSGKRVPWMVVSCPWGTQIRAIFDGKVIFNDTLPGYGRVFIIDHGKGYLSLVAQGQSFSKDVGTEVAEGEVIGISGGGPWISEGIYIEIRHNGRQLRPLSWFDLRGIEIEKR